MRGKAQYGRGCYCEADFDLSADEAAGNPGPGDCTLDSDVLAARISQCRELADAAASVEHASGTVRLVLPPSPGMIAAVAALSAAETACCAQTRLLLDITASQLIVTIEAPDSAGLSGTLYPASTPIRQ